MSKILDSEFRNNLYKNLVDAGYEKNEAQAIVGKKYFVALKENVNNTLNDAIKRIDADDFEVSINEKEFNDAIAELKKMKEFLNKKEK